MFLYLDQPELERRLVALLDAKESVEDAGGFTFSGESKCEYQQFELGEVDVIDNQLASSSQPFKADLRAQAF